MESEEIGDMNKYTVKNIRYQNSSILNEKTAYANRSRSMH